MATDPRSGGGGVWSGKTGRPATLKGRNGRPRNRQGKGRDGQSRPVAAEAALEAVLGEALAFERPADVVMSEFFRRHKGLGRQDRSLIARRLFAVLRNRRLYAHLAESGFGPNARRLALIADQDQSEQLLSRRPGEAEWLEHVGRVDRANLPFAIRFSLPDWLHQALSEQTIPDGIDALAQALLAPAALDLRANLLKSDVARLVEILAAEQIRSAPPADLPASDLATALRVAGHPALERLQAFQDGLFEVQDAGSQWVVQRAGVRRGQTVVDFCAGAGGKTLAMAALMRSSGQIYACDTSLRRLARLKPRLARSGATNVQPMYIETETDARLHKLRGLADVVLVDAPCSGTGTLRRNPDLKWRQSPESVARLTGLQQAIMAAAAPLVKPGGRLVYVTCSLLSAENEQLAEAFEASAQAATGGFVRVDLATGTAPLEGSTGFSRLWPHLHQVDGFFMAAWQRPR